METFKEIVECAALIHTNQLTMRKYMNFFETITREIEPEEIYEAVQQNSSGLFALLPLYAGSLFKHRRFEEIYEFLRDIDLTGTDRHTDFFNSKLIKYYYISLKYLGKSTECLYPLMVSNKEYENRYSVAVLRNCILDSQINTNVYYSTEAEVGGTGEEAARHAFYLGYISLVRGDYEKSRSLLGHAGVLTKSKVLDLNIKKCMIICKLAMSDYTISYPFISALRPYFSLVGAVRRGEGELFEEILDKYADEFFSMNLFFVARRLVKNLLLEGLRKISMCYSRISVDDISELLGTNATYLLYTAIQGKLVKGYVTEGIFYGGNLEPPSIDLGESIKEVIDLRETIANRIQYPEIPQLSYEYVLELEHGNE